MKVNFIKFSSEFEHFLSAPDFVVVGDFNRHFVLWIQHYYEHQDLLQVSVLDQGCHECHTVCWP